MRATFPPQSSDSREPTPKPSDRPALSLALSTALSREDRLGSGEPRVDRHLIYGTPEAPHRALTIGRASSEDSGLRQSLYGSEKAPAENSPGVYDTSPSSRSSEPLFTPHDRTSDSPSTPYSAVTSSTAATTTSSSSDGPTSHIKPLDLDTSPPGDATPAASDSFTFVSIASSDPTQKTLSKQQMADSRTPPGGSSSEANRPSVGNRGRTHSQTARRNLQPHPRSQSFVNPASLYPGPTHGSEQASSPSVPPYPHSPLTHQPYPPPSAPPYMGATYTVIQRWLHGLSRDLFNDSPCEYGATE
ncbi:hypothetical protein QCA50_006781 [Cerrena zonata]|uniref:Uncharacterized protein n=1 Tax=Cerrena zonata TaxID=2478898 RepID=A0AAW0GJR6_9APHY